MSEVRRLEDVRYQQMVDLVLSKGAELSAMCLDSHVEQPAGLQQALDAIHGNDRNPGAAAELLAKLLHMLAEVQVREKERGRERGRKLWVDSNVCACVQLSVQGNRGEYVLAHLFQMIQLLLPC